MKPNTRGIYVPRVGHCVLPDVGLAVANRTFDFLFNLEVFVETADEFPRAGGWWWTEPARFF